MRLHGSLLVAIGLAIAWAGLMFGLYFAAINWLPAFEDWSSSDRIEAFAAVVGLAGFGGGLIALFFAGQQLTHLFTDPVITIVYVYEEHEYPSGARVNAEADHLNIWLDLVNRSDNICSLWQVSVVAPAGAFVAGSKDWMFHSDTETSYQSGPRDVLYPKVPHRIGGVRLRVPDYCFSSDPPGGRYWSGRLVTKIVTERRMREEHIDITLIIPPQPKMEGPRKVLDFE